MRVVLDTSVVIYAIPIVAPAGQEHEATEARELLNLAEAEPEGSRRPARPSTSAFTFALAMPTLAELLVRVSAPKRAEVADVLASMFEVIEFDRQAAIVAAGLLAHRPKGPRKVVIFDVQIVACALRTQADGFCTFDPVQANTARRAAPTLLVGPPAVFLTGRSPPLFTGGM